MDRLSKLPPLRKYRKGDRVVKPTYSTLDSHKVGVVGHDQEKLEDEVWVQWPDGFPTSIPRGMLSLYDEWLAAQHQQAGTLATYWTGGKA